MRPRVGRGARRGAALGAVGGAGGAAAPEEVAWAETAAAAPRAVGGSQWPAVPDGIPGTETGTAAVAGGAAVPEEATGAEATGAARLALGGPEAGVGGAAAPEADGSGTAPRRPGGSHALCPVSVMPGRLRAVSAVSTANPLSCQVDALRGLLLVTPAHLAADYGVLAVAAALGVTAASSLLGRLAR
ncbi:hypothetical protein EDD94_4752 [Streptomyces sp. PanSC9]|nr:hypothetical protein EDD94_4752 [Streptomyces sp. PanSC9]